MADPAALSDDVTSLPSSSRPTRRGLLVGLGVAATAASLAAIAVTDRSKADASPSGMSPRPSGGDDTSALQDWLDRGGTSLVFSVGTYRTSRTLTIPSGVSVDGRGATLRATGPFHVVTFGGDGVSLTGLEIDGGGRSPSGAVDPGVAGVLIPAAGRGTVRNCRIHDMPAIGISVNGGSGAYLVTGNTITNCGRQAVSIDHSDNGRVTGNHIDTALHGVQWWGGDSALTSAIGIRGIVVSNNRIANVMGGVWGSLGQHITVTGNRIANCSDVGVDFEGCQDCVATGNTVHNAAHACYAVFFGSQRITFDGNTGLNDAGASRGSGFMSYHQPASQSIQVSNNQLQTVGAPPINTDRASLASSTVVGNTLTAAPGVPAVNLRNCQGIQVAGNQVAVAQ